MNYALNCGFHYPLELKIFINDDVVLAIGYHIVGITSRGDDFDIFPESRNDTVNHTVDHGCRSVDNTALHTFKGVAPDEVARLLNVDGRQL